jgi:hypothetical protein
MCRWWCCVQYGPWHERLETVPCVDVDDTKSEITACCSLECFLENIQVLRYGIFCTVSTWLAIGGAYPDAFFQEYLFVVNFTQGVVETIETSLLASTCRYGGNSVMQVAWDLMMISDRTLSSSIFSLPTR